MLPTASFLLGLVVTTYLATFVIFAVLRIVTGISIQRVGYSGFRRIAFSPKHGVKIHIRGIGLSVHRPTFARPTWISLNITEPQVTIDLRALGASETSADNSTAKSKPSAENSGTGSAAGHLKPDKWEILSAAKDKVKRLHRQVKWMKHIDLVIVGARLTIQEVGTLGIERLALSVDTRPKTVDRSRLFQHRKAGQDTQTPAEWKSIVRIVLFTPEGKESIEILDYCAFSVHGFLHSSIEGLRDASISLKLGRLTIPYDDILATSDKVKMIRHESLPRHRNAPAIAINDVRVEDVSSSSSLDDRFAETVSGSQDFVTSILRGIQEIQLAVGFVGLSKRVKSLHRNGNPVHFNLALKEVGLDITRLDSRSPAHRMYFSPNDVAHQALVTAISIAAGVDDGQKHPQRILYIPMITATAKTTLPSKMVTYADATNASERNSNILFANFVCTSPSLDLNPRHLPLLLEIAKSKQSSESSPIGSSLTPKSMISRLLPRAIIKMAIQEPVIRVSLPPLDPNANPDTDYDLLISSTSTMAMDIDAQHSADTEVRYNLLVEYRHSSHALYYQSNAGEKHDLLQTDTIDVKFDVNALPEKTVYISAKFSSFSLFLVRPEISEGIRQIITALRKEATPASKTQGFKKPSFLRQIPAWVQNVNLQGSDFNVELAGVDSHVSKYSRGFALQLESWSAEYKVSRDDIPEYIPRRSRSSSRSLSRGRVDLSRTPSEAKPRRKISHPTDGRRLAIHVQGLEGLIIDNVPESLAEPFVTLPRFEVAFSTSTDAQGPLFHINSHAKSLRIQYSLYNHFAIGIAVLTFRRMFGVLGPHGAEKSHKSSQADAITASTQSDRQDPNFNEVTTVDFKANLVQVKAKMPDDPPLMLQIFGIDAGRHRWATPFVRSKAVNLLAGTPGMTGVWSRIVSIRGLRLDLRETRHKMHDKTVKLEKSFDISTEAIRLGIPHGLVLHAVFDNVINTIKTTEQLHHHFNTGSNEYILTKHPEGPKSVPRVSIRSQVLVFEMEDSPFEWKLGTIYRAGLIEQTQRIARAETFRLKVKKMEAAGQRRGSSRLRASSAQPSSRSGSHSGHDNNGRLRSKSQHPTIREESPEGLHRGRGRKMRYDAEGKCEMSAASHLSVEKAHERLQIFNAESWKKRIDQALHQQQNIMKDLRGILLGMEELPEEAEQHEPIMGLPQRPSLMSAVISDLGIVIDKPSFSLDKLPDFLHDIGKGMPKDMDYGLLVPMNLKVNMGEIRISLRDYPLPLLHVPPTRTRQSPRLPGLQLTTDFVIAEEFQGIESQRHINVVVCPDDKLGKDDIAKRFAIDVRRTISAVKTYSDMRFEINTSAPTRITWGTSYQPAIQDMMQVIESLTKPPMDPSDRVGFWDKIRLSFHSRIDVAWKGDGDVHLVLKGSRSPYIVIGTGAGFVMVWRNNVRLRIAQDEDPRKFMMVDSGDYLLAVPDFNSFAMQASEDDTDFNGASSTSSAKNSALFKKVIMKLSGNVRWGSGLMFERDLEGGKRTFDFCPHYKVVLKHPDHAHAPPGQTYDAFRNFRSHHIHMSIAVAAPVDRDWNVSNLKPSSNYNSVHLTPRFFTHFFDWWSLFSGVMSLPVRQGPLWGNIEKSSKKFGRHLATIKYNLLFSPLFISHIYKHKDAEDYASDDVSATGLKMKLDSFMLDLHQRRETFEIPGHGGSKPKRTSQMKINQCQLDFISADIRAVSAIITGTSSKHIDEVDEQSLAAYQSVDTSKIDMSKFTIPDNDFTWIDMDDFVELDWILPTHSNPETKILPLTFGPRFTYFRQTDHGNSVSGDPTRTSAFGDEPTHFCVMSQKNDFRTVQADLIQSRISRIEEQIAHNEHAVGEQELKVIRDSQNAALVERLQNLRDHTEALQKKHVFLEEMLKTILQLSQDDPSIVPPAVEAVYDYPHTGDDAEGPPDETSQKGRKPPPEMEFNNRFVFHNPQIKWNNSLRNIILRYIHQVGQRRGFVYYMSRRAVKFILDILEEREKSKQPQNQEEPQDKNPAATPPESPGADDTEIQERIDELLRDGKNFVNADDDERRASNVSKAESDAGNNVSTEYIPQSTYHFRLIAPQIQLQSEKNPKSVVLIAAKGMQFKVVQIMDKDRVMDEVSGLVQRRFSANMDSLQIFVTSLKTFSTEYLHMYSVNHYGGKKSDYWPPWVPMEMMFEFSSNPYGFSRVVHRTSVSLRYDKYNNLRLKYNEDVSGSGESRQQSPEGEESRMDHIWIEFPHFRAICDSDQYYAMYVIALDLLLYSEPLEKTRSERLEKIMLASDFEDLRGAPEMVQMLQQRIRQLEEIKMHFQIHESILDRQGWKDRIAVDQDLTNCEDELFFIVKAITTSQRRIEDRHRPEEASNGLLRWLISSKEIAWHLIRDKEESLVEFQLRDAQFARTDNNDGSNYNCVEIGRINGFNLLQNAVYPEIIAPYVDASKGFPIRRDVDMLRVQWLQLEPIAGIQVVDSFEVNVMPLRVQLEREVAKKLFEYIFPGIGGNAFEGSGLSPFMVKNIPSANGEEDDDDSSSPRSHHGAMSPTFVDDQISGDAIGVGTGAGELEHRLQPTMKLPEKKALTAVKKQGPSSSSHSGLSHWNFFQSNRSQTSVARKQATFASIPGNSSMISRTGSDKSLVPSNDSASFSEEKKRPGTSHSFLPRKKEKEQPSDDLTEMMNRASNYMTLAYFKIPSTVLCLSYKGRGQRNLEDVHDLVFRLPAFEYRNKTWSNLDLALQIKKDLIKALISHTGAIIGNKFSHHRPSRQQAQSRLKEIANMSTLLNFTDSSEDKEDVSLYENDDWEERPSFQSARPSTHGGLSPSFASSSVSLHKTKTISSSKSYTPGLTLAKDTTDDSPGSSTNGHRHVDVRPHTHDGESSGGHERLSASSHSLVPPPPNLWSTDRDPERNRSGSLGHRLSVMGQKFRQTAEHAAIEDAEDGSTKRKHKILLGGQKLLNKLPHPKSEG